MPKESTRTRRGNIPSSPSKDTSGRRCRRCEHSPLLSQCEHTSAGRQFLADQRTQETERPKSRKASPKCRICEGRPERAQCPHTKVGLAFLKEKQILQDMDNDFQLNGTTFGMAPASTASAVPELSSEGVVDRVKHFLEMMNDSGTTPSSTHVLLQQLVQGLEGIPFGGTPPTDGSQSVPPLPASPFPHPPLANATSPFAIGSSQNPDSATPPPSESRPEQSTNIRETSPDEDGTRSASPAPSFDTNVDPNLDPSLPSPPKSGSNRATKSNPKHGYIPGVMRGAHVYKIVRKHARPEPLEEATKASKRFLETMQRLVEKCDDLATATGCWLFLGAQHISGVSPTIHYTSPRLSRDAPTFMDDVANEFCRLIANLLQSRRTDALSLVTKLHKTEEEKAQAEEEKQKMARRMMELESLVDRYSGMLGIQSGDQSQPHAS